MTFYDQTCSKQIRGPEGVTDLPDVLQDFILRFLAWLHTYGPEGMFGLGGMNSSDMSGFYFEDDIESLTREAILSPEDRAFYEATAPRGLTSREMSLVTAMYGFVRLETLISKLAACEDSLNYLRQKSVSRSQTKTSLSLYPCIHDLFCLIRKVLTTCFSNLSHCNKHIQEMSYRLCRRNIPP